MKTEKIWHVMTADAVTGECGVSPETGLNRSDVNERLRRHGHNELTRAADKPWWHILWAQFKNLLVGLLAAAAAVSFLLGDIKDCIAILVIVALNALLGFKQEYSAEQAMAALRRMSVPKARVRRGGGRVMDVDARELVPGDIVLLEAGNLVPADGRLLISASLRVQEAALTGESEAVAKQTQPVERPDAAVGDRRNMVYMGTVVTYGRGEAVVTATGMDTELGRVAGLLAATEDEQTPLAAKIAHVGHVLIGIALALIALVALIGFWRGDSLSTVFMTAVSMAVAAVPEGLPAVVTIALALGAKRMFARRALIRSLSAVETLGAVTEICTDKTGTLTQNEMTVTQLTLPGRSAACSANTAEPIAVDDDAGDVRLLLTAAALCTDAELNTADGERRAIGDPTEGALVIAAARAGLPKSEVVAAMPRTAEAPFDSDRKRMTTLHVPASGATGVAGRMIQELRALHPELQVVAFAKGATDSILAVCNRIRIGNEVVDLNAAQRERMAAEADTLAGRGIRVLAVAYRPCAAADADASPAELERDLVLLGLVGMMDPLRESVKASVRTCMDAGIRPVMITGDHPLMASHIGQELGLKGADRALTGPDLQRMQAAELKACVQKASVFARVSPEHKLEIVDALQAAGGIVAMTGDGVNDAPALKSADIGVAMGITGTDVAKEASDMILLDDSYSTIVAAVREGRVIFDNIRRFIRYILASNMGELLVMLLAPFFGLPLPLLPVQILWMNLVTDGLPALALGVEQAEGDVMKRPPRNPSQPIIDRDMIRQVVWVGLLMAVLSLVVGAGAFNGVAEPAGVGHHAVRNPAVWQTLLFTTMVFMQLFLALAVRSTRQSLFKIGLFSNKPLLAALAGTTLLQLCVIYLPPFQAFFHTRPLSAGELGLSIAVAAAVFVAVEIEKAVGGVISALRTGRLPFAADRAG